MKFLTCILLICSAATANAQNLLGENMSLKVNRQRLDQALEILSNRGNFFFSYNSSILKKDSLVDADHSNKPLRAILDNLLGPGFEYRESGNYIIIRRAPLRLRLVTSSASTEDKFYTISGYVIDDQTGERISDANVYEKERLAISSTNRNGFFKLRLRSKYSTAAITVSKEYYYDTTIKIQPRFNQSVTITLIPVEINERTVVIGPQGYQAPESIDLEIPVNDSVSWIYRYVKRDSAIVEKTAVGRFLVSSRQKLQSINLRQFFTARPYQASIVPGLSTNGKLNGQVINNFSLNVFGGYSGGTNGFELAGLFNINKKDAKYFQMAGLFNVVGGSVDGLQTAGISNTVLDSVDGVQIGGVTNYSRQKFSGLQLGGVFNHIGTELDGVQIAGVGNFSKKEVNGVQIGGVFNYTKKLKGVQIGLINICDTSEGYSIGLINIVLKGYHKLSLYNNEVMPINASIKSGNSKLYSIFIGGYNWQPDEKIWSFGYGLGSEFISRNKFALNGELTAQRLHLGSWDYVNLLNRASILFSYKLGKKFSIFAGPVYSVYVSDQTTRFGQYKQFIPSSSYNTNKLGNNVTGWFGWSAGINIF